MCTLVGGGVSDLFLSACCLRGELLAPLLPLLADLSRDLCCLLGGELGGDFLLGEVLGDLLALLGEGESLLGGGLRGEGESLLGGPLRGEPGDLLLGEPESLLGGAALRGEGDLRLGGDCFLAAGEGLLLTSFFSATGGEGLRPGAFPEPLPSRLTFLDFFLSLLPLSLLESEEESLLESEEESLEELLLEELAFLFFLASLAFSFDRPLRSSSLLSLELSRDFFFSFSIFSGFFSGGG